VAQAEPSSAGSALTPASPPPTGPYTIEDGEFSIEPMYWLNRAQPTLRGGAAATADGSLDFVGQSKYGYEGIISLPAGPQNSPRVSYFRLQGTAMRFLRRATSLCSTRTTTAATISAPAFTNCSTLPCPPQAMPIQSRDDDSTSGTTDYKHRPRLEQSYLSHAGAGLEQASGKHFRWEANTSGF
jgi:hypothetical protein